MTRRLAYETLDVFTRRRFAGNPLAVVHDAEGLTLAEMQTLAAEFNYSETVFLGPPADPANTAAARIFNRTHEMPFAGHPSIGAAVALARLGRARDGQVRLEVPAGLVKAVILEDDEGLAIGAAIVAPQPLSLGEILDPADIAACLGLPADQLLTAAHPPRVASMGVTFVLAELAAEALARCAPDPAAFRRTVVRHPALNGRLSLHAYVREDERLRARMFAPLAGTSEDPATGSANGPLGGLLLSLSGADKARFTVTQGVEMGRPSELLIKAWREGSEIRAEIAGHCASVMRGEVLV